MKRTLPLITVNDNKYSDWTIHEKITCRVVGEMSDKSKVWEDENGKQYMMFRMLGKCYFAEY